MKQHFYYADLDWHVEIDDGMSGVLKTMVGVEIHALQLQVWQTISTFLTTRALYLTKPPITPEQDRAALEDEKRLDNGG